MNQYYLERFIKITGEDPEVYWEDSSDTTPIDVKVREFVEEYEESQARAWIGHKWRTI